MKKHYRQENDCLNCGTILEGKFCHNCGQENLEIKESFGHMMNHAISDYFHFDHQFFHTLKPLLFRPGFLTNEYMSGRRAQYLHPVKMYIFISIVYFLLLFKTGNDTEVVKLKADPKNPAHSEKVTDSVSKAIINNHNISANDKKKLLAKIKKEGVKTDTVNENFKSGLLILTSDSSYSQYLARQQKLAPAERANWFERLVNKKAFYYKEKYGNRSKEVFFDEVRHNIPKMMFIMLPLFALILKITFWRNKKFYVEHLIYAFHLHCFLFTFLAFIMVLLYVMPANDTLIESISFAAFFYIVWYIYKSLKVVYKRSGFRTITKFIGMYITYFALFTACVAIVIFITALTI